MSKLQDELRRKFATPQAALKAMGLSPSLLEPPRMACDEADQRLGQVLRSLPAEPTPSARRDSYATRWPQASRISVEY